MEEEVLIKKIVLDDTKDFNVNLILDLKNRCIKKSVIEYNTFLELFNIKSPLFFYRIDSLNLVLCSDNCLYYCHNCIFGYNISNNGETTIFCNSIDYIISNTKENYNQLKVKQYTIDFELPKCIRDNYITQSIKFKYSKSLSVSLEKKRRHNQPCILTLNITSNIDSNAIKLSNLANRIYELLMIYFGVGLKMLNRYYTYNNLVMNFYSSIVDRYECGVKNSVSFSNLVLIDNKSLNREIIKKYISFDKDTLLLNGIYQTIINSDTYREIKINMIIQCIEGFYNSIYGKNHKHQLPKVLEEVFLKNPDCKKILSNLDKRLIYVNGKKQRVFLYKAKNHRNYFSHLNINERKKVFEKMQINYAYWKILIAYRLLVLQYLNITYDNDLLNEMINDINDYKKEYKIRLSL